MNLIRENKLTNKIKAICINWNKKFEKIALQSVFKRENYARSLKDFVHCLISIFFFPNFSNSKIFYFFDDLSNQNFFSLLKYSFIKYL